MPTFRALDDMKPVDDLIEVTEQIKKLEAKQEELRMIVLDALLSEPDQKNQYGGYDFSTNYRQTFTYSPELQEQEANLKAAKKYEEKKGIAKLKSSKVSLVMKRAR